MRCWSDAIAGRVFSIVLASWFLPGDCSMAAQPNKVRISYSSRSNSNTPFIIALNKGFFVEEGLDVELIQVNPRLGATAVLNGDLDFTTTFGTTLRGARQQRLRKTPGWQDPFPESGSPKPHLDSYEP